MVQKMKILGTSVNDKLTWSENCAELIKNINSRMMLLRNMKAFGATKEELVMCRSKLEQACVLWHSSLTQENTEDLERTQKTFTKLVLQEKYINYEEALIQLNLNSLAERRRHLCLKFAQSGEKHGTLTDLFTKNDKNHDMKMRKSETYKVNFANTERYRKSSVVYLQSELNNNLL